MTAKLYTIAPQLVVPDVVEAAQYYEKFYGFENLGYFADPPVYGMVRRDGAMIHFGQSKQPPNTNRAVRPGSFDAYIWVDDIHALHEEFVNRGANILEGPVERIYGRTEVIVQDLNGYTIAFGQ